MTKRDGEQARRLRVLMRFLGGRGYLQSQGWLPHSGTNHRAMFASYWPLMEESADGGVRSQQQGEGGGGSDLRSVDSGDARAISERHRPENVSTAAVAPRQE